MADGRDAPTTPAALCAGGSAASSLRIAARDLLGVADLPAVGRELAALAAGVPRGRARASPTPTSPIAVIGMGKLGGRELNYASDVDVLFVHDGDADAAERAARAVLATMIDADARTASCSAPTPTCGPRAAPGPLTRTLDSYARLLGAVGADLGVPGAHQGAAGRRRRRPRRARSSTRADAVRVARACSTPTRSARSAR